MQHALAAAVEVWSRASAPENPSAWLFRVAHNHLVGELRRSARHAGLDAQQGVDAVHAANDVRAFLEGDVRDASLRMLFACCDATALATAPSAVVRKALERRLVGG